MSPNRTRAPPRPRSTRIAPYERIADTEMPQHTTANPTTSRSINAAPATSSRPTIRPPPPGTVTRNEPAAPVLPTEEERVTLSQLAVKWSSSRKLSLELFHADLAASFERHSAWHGSGRKLQPTEAEHILRTVERHWRSSASFRNSQSDLFQAVELWMTGTRDVEESERMRAETDRKSNLEEEEGKADLYANAAAERDAEREPNLALLESDSLGDDEVDVTSDKDGEIAGKSGGSLRVLRPDERPGEQDNDEEYDSYDDDPYESDDSKDAAVIRHNSMIFAFVAAVVIMDDYF
jgi:hypothetical protein